MSAKHKNSFSRMFKIALELMWKARIFKNRRKTVFLDPKKGSKMVIFGYLNNSKSGGFRRYVVMRENTFFTPPKIPPFLTPPSKRRFWAFWRFQPKACFFLLGNSRARNGKFRTACVVDSLMHVVLVVMHNGLQW